MYAGAGSQKQNVDVGMGREGMEWVGGENHGEAT